jgi:hypothetical protein
VMEQIGAAGTDDFRSGRFNPLIGTIPPVQGVIPQFDMTSIMINPFIKAGGLEFFGVAEFISLSNLNRDREGDRTWTRNWTQLGAELLYRFGAEENFYIGGRYNTASGQLEGQENDKVTINRVNLGGGWFMTKNILTKLEYVSQTYNDFPSTGGHGLTRFDGGKFNGFMVEAVISF